MTADLATLQMTAPAADVGTPTGDGDWRIVCEVLLPAHHASVVGVARVGVDKVSADVWTDMRDYLTGWEITDGTSDFGGHPAPSILTATFRSPAGRFSPWRAAGRAGSGSRFRAGTLIRVVMFDPVADVWHPLFTGEIETAVEQSAGGDAVTVLTVTALDTVSARLPAVQLIEYQIDPDVTPFTISEAVADLLAVADWPYGTVVDVQRDDSDIEYRLIGSTTVNGNVAEIVRRIADSVGRQFSADRYGRAAFVRTRPQLATYTNAYTSGTDPNEPDAVTIDTATDHVGADTVHPYFADLAVVNAVEGKGLHEPGIFGGATVGDGAEAVRLAAVTSATVRHGLESASTEVVDAAASSLFRFNDVSVELADTHPLVRRHGRRRRVLDTFPTYYQHFVAGYVAQNLVDLFADDVWIVPDLTLDNRSADKIAAARVGAPVTVTHDGATFTGRIAGLTIRSTPLQNRCDLTAVVTVHAYDFERPTA